MGKKPIPAHLDPVERLRTARHEMSHALISYALECTQITATVFKRPRKHPSRPEMRCLGICGQYFRRPHHGIFVTCGPFASPAYAVDTDDEVEFRDMVNEFIRFTGKSAASFRSCVLDPVRNLLDSEPAVKIITHIAVPMSKGGVLNCPTHKHMEKLFPKNFSWPLLEALCRSVREAADDLPLVSRKSK